MKSQQCSPTMPVERSFCCISRWEPRIRAFTYLDRKIPDPQVRGENGSLWGIPIGVKDMIDVADMPTTGGSRVYKWVASEDALAVKRLRNSGAVIIGKTNTHELAYGVVTPPTRNPWDLDRIPGGSSGGSAAAVATGMVLGALGTDTGGSVRIPAALCGVVGFKPTVGAIPTEGVMRLSQTLDHVGLLSLSAEDVCLLFHECRNEAEMSFGGGLNKKGHLTIPWNYVKTYGDPAVLDVFLKTVACFHEAGWQVDYGELERWESWRYLQLTIRLPEAYHYHRAVLQGNCRNLLSSDLRSRLDAGKHVLAVEYVAAQEERHRLIRLWTDRLKTYDALVMPTVPCGAPKLGVDRVTLGDQNYPIWEAFVVFTAPWNVLGFPSISVPMGFNDEGMPLAIQIIGRPFADETVLSIADQYEKLRGKFPTK